MLANPHAIYNIARVLKHGVSRIEVLSRYASVGKLGSIQGMSITTLGLTARFSWLATRNLGVNVPTSSESSLIRVNSRNLAALNVLV